MRQATPRTPQGEARHYAQQCSLIDPWVPLARVIEEAFLAGYVAAEERALLLPPPQRPDPLTSMPVGGSIDRPLLPLHPIVHAPAAPPLSPRVVESSAVDGESGVYPGSGRTAPEPEPDTDQLRPLLHKHGEKPCHKPAMYLARMLTFGEPPDLGLLRLLPDLRIPTPLDPPVCGSCGLAIDPYTQRDLDWAPHFDRSTPRFGRGPLRSAPESGPDDPRAGLARGDPDGPPPPVAEEPYPSDAVAPAPTAADHVGPADVVDIGRVPDVEAAQDNADLLRRLEALAPVQE